MAFPKATPSTHEFKLITIIKHQHFQAKTAMEAEQWQPKARDDASCLNASHRFSPQQLKSSSGFSQTTFPCKSFSTH